MTTTYATQELRNAMENASGLPRPDRRNLIYLVTCPLTNEPCHIKECEYGSCDNASLDELDEDSGVPDSEIHISAVPHPDEPHPMPPIDNDHDWTVAVTEATLMLDQQRLEELDQTHQEWLGAAEQRTARSTLVEAITTLMRASDHERRKCQTCRKDHVSDHENCPACQRLMNHDAKRLEYQATPATA